MRDLGIKKEDIEIIARKHNIKDENVINFISEVINTNNSIIEEYLKSEYLDTVSQEFQQRGRRIR